MATGGRMKEILLHGGSAGTLDRAVSMARQLADAFGARLHVVFTLEDPLSAGWTAEMSAERLPELHQAMEQEARERLARLISAEDQERLGVEIVLRTGAAADEIVLYTKDHAIDLAIVQSPASGGGDADVARALLDRGDCAVLVVR